MSETTPSPEETNAFPSPASGEVEELVSPVTRTNLAILCIIFLLFIAVWLTQSFTAVVIMLTGSLLFTYLMLGPVRLIENGLCKIFPKPRRRDGGFRRTLAILCVYILFLGGFGFSFLRVAVPLTLQMKEFAQEAPGYLSTFDQFLLQVEEGLKPRPSRQHSPQRASTLPASEQVASLSPSQLRSQTARFSMDKLREISQKAAHLLLNIGAGAISSLVYALSALMLAFYLLVDGKTIHDGIVNLMPARHEESTKRFLHRVNIQLYKLVKAQAMMGILSGAVIYLLLWLLQVKYALLLGVFFGVASLPPIIGPWLGLLPLMVILPLGGHPFYIMYVLIAAGLFHAVKIYWLWPRFLHSRYHIHPVLFIFTFLVCLNTMGWIGILPGFPLAGVLGVYIDMLKTRHQEADAP